MNGNTSDRRPAPASPPPLAPGDLAAAEWLVRHDRGLDAESRREFEAWLSADARHADAWERQSEAWALLDRVPADRVPIGAPARPRRRFAALAPLAAAAVLALGIGYVALRELVPVNPFAMRTAVTPVGGTERMELPDGSVAHVNTASELRFAFDAAARRVVLARGEATFEVAKDPERPFVVEAGGVRVRAVGTAFNVRHRSDAIEVLVTEGRVQVDPVPAGRSKADVAETRATARLIVANERARVALTTQADGGDEVVIEKVSEAEAARALAWRERRLEFGAEPLEAIVAEFNRYNEHQLVIVDSVLAKKRFGGKFACDDVEKFVQVLVSSFGVNAERQAQQTILRSSASASDFR